MENWASQTRVAHVRMNTHHSLQYGTHCDERFELLTWFSINYYRTTLRLICSCRNHVPRTTG